MNLEQAVENNTFLPIYSVVGFQEVDGLGRQVMIKTVYLGPWVVNAQRTIGKGLHLDESLVIFSL